jgi:5'-nucleotidase
MKKEDIFIQTYSGKMFNIFDFGEDDIDIVDIAHSLSLICRFNGHCKEFVSVAQHSVLASKKMEQIGCVLSLFGLLHDSSEAYLGDIITPLKNTGFLTENFYMYEKELQKVIFDKFIGINLDTITKSTGVSAYKNYVDYIDLKMLATEKRDLLNKCEIDWSKDLPEPYDEKIVPWRSWYAKQQFLNRYSYLKGKLENGV